MCSVEHCESKVVGRGLCSKHWQQAKKNGTLPTQWTREQRGALPEMMKAKAAAQTHCKNGHPLSGENLVLQGPYRKFRVCRICRAERQRRRYHEGKPQEIQA